MSRPILMALAEDVVARALLVRLVDHADGELVAPPMIANGRAAFWRRAREIRVPPAVGLVVGLCDLDADPCPSELLRTQLGDRGSGLSLRIAVRESESWLLADSQGLAALLRLPEAKIPREPDLEQDPKQTLVNLARSSPVKEVRQDIVPPRGSARRVGSGYNALMERFAMTDWSPVRASRRSPSLHRSLKAIRRVCG